MAREGLRSHLSGTVPISIACHLVALLLLLIVPLTAEVTLPTPMVSLPDYIRLAPMPPPPEVTMRPAQRSPAATSTDEAARVPIVAPPTIEPETESRVIQPGPVLPDATGGLPPGAGGPPVGSLVSVPAPPAPPRQAAPVRVADLPLPPKKIVDARPIYPDIARAARVEGTVVVEAVLDPAGRVTQLRVIKSVPMLDQAALDAVGQWRYTPSRYGGHPVSVLMTITIRFTLQ